MRDAGGVERGEIVLGIYCMRKESLKKLKKNIVNPYCSYSELEIVFTEAL